MKTDLDKIKIKPLPYLRIFIGVFLFINLVGIVNFPFYLEKVENNILYFLMFIGLTGFFMGTMIVRSLKIKIPKSKGRDKPKLLRLVFFTSNFISFVLILITHIMNGGIIILMGAARFQTLSYTNIFIYLGIVSTLLFLANELLLNKKAKYWHIGFILIQSLSVLSLGYRSPMIILLFGCAVIFIIIRNDFQTKYKDIFTIRYGIILVGLLIFMSGISSYRVAQQYDVRKFFRNMDWNYLDKHSYLKPFMPSIAVFRFDQDVVKKLVQKTQGNHFHGRLAMSNFLTVLPGEQWGMRNIIGELVEARRLPSGKPWSITPTLQGALFVDGGYIAVLLGFFLLGGFIEFLKKLMKSKQTPYSVVLYALFAINSLMLIHTGYFDVVFFILITIIFFLNFIIMRIRYSIPEEKIL